MAAVSFHAIKKHIKYLLKVHFYTKNYMGYHKNIVVASKKGILYRYTLA